MGIISPSYQSLKQFDANLSGTKFSICAPEHIHSRIPENKQSSLRKNLYDEHNFGQYTSEDDREVFSFSLKHIDWTFYRRRYLLLVDSVGHVTFTAKVVKLEQFASLFNKCHFESAVERLLFARGGAYASSGMCRLNWRIKNYNDTQWVVFENDGRFASAGLHNPCKSVIQTFFLTPITDEHLLAVFFTQVELPNAPDLSSEFEMLRERVMETAELTLSEDSTRQLQAIQKANPDQQYSQHLPPYEFNLMPYPEEPKVIEHLVAEKGSDYINSLPVPQANKMIDECVKKEVEKYKAQVDSIMASHLRFKN